MRYDQKDYWQRRRPCQDATPWQSKQQGRVAFLITTRKGTGRRFHGGGLLTAAYHLKRCRSPPWTSRAGRHFAYRGIFLAAGLAHGPQARYTAARFVAAGRLMFCGMALREPDTGVCRPYTCGGLGGFYRVAFQHASRLFSNFCLAIAHAAQTAHLLFMIDG